MYKCSTTTSAYCTLYTYSQALVQHNSTLELHCGAVLLLHSCTFLQKQYSYTVQLHTVHCTATVTVIMYICTVELHYYSKFKFCISHESAPFNSPSFFTTDFHFRATKKLPMKKITLLMMIMSAMMIIMMIIYITV